MADEIVDGLLGGEGAAQEAEDLKAIVGADALAAAISMDQAGYGPGVSKAAEAFLVRQSRLLETQNLQAQAEHRLHLALLNGRLVGLRVKNGLQLFTAIVATAVALGVLWMIVSAFDSREVVVDAFESPPALAARGLSGKVAAGAVLDTLSKLQAATRTNVRGLKTVSAWSSEIKVDVPETGVTLGEVDRMLRQRFGHDLHIGGDLTVTATGELAMTVRGDRVPARTFRGGPDDLDTLAAQAAEYIFGRSQPAQYARYLDTNRREKDALDFIPGALRRADNDDDRGDLANAWAIALGAVGDYANQKEKYRLALSFKPGNWKYWSNLLAAIRRADGEEAAWRASQRFLKAAGAAPTAGKPQQRYYVNAANYTSDLPFYLSILRADLASNGGAGAFSTETGPRLAEAYYRAHDDAQAARALALSDPDDPQTKAANALLQGYSALDRGEPAAAAEPLQAFWTLRQAERAVFDGFNDKHCYLGLALGLAGRLKEADAAFQAAGPWSLCYALHGDMLVHAGDRARAEQVWAEGLRVSPDLPYVYLHRGLSELSRGDLDRAGKDFATANAKAPHWADPLKSWGDLLARQGRWKAALEKYDEALNYAPAWSALKLARGNAARQAGGIP
jgi:tetratricopeptide (TPR) repeat protein